MPSEAAKGLGRMAANYGRLALTLAIGVALVRIQTNWLGREGFGLLSLALTTVSMASMLLEVIERSMIRELGAARQSGDAARFAAVYNSALVTCAAAAAVTAGLYGVLLAVLPVFNIPPHLMGAARWLIAGDGVGVIVWMVLAPTMNMMVVSERFVASNIFYTLLRTNYLTPAVVLYYGMGITDDPARALTLYGVWIGILNSAMVAGAAGLLMLLDRRLVPRPWLATRGVAREVAGSFGWNSSLTVAMNLHERVGPAIGNLAFGSGALLWNAAFGLAMRLVGYVRVAATGMTFGLDAVSARVSTQDRTMSGVQRLVHHSTRLHAFVAFPAGVAVMALTEPLMRLWLDPDSETAAAIPSAVTMVRILVVAIVARSISDSWISILYGAGHIRRIAPLVFIGGVLNPVSTVLLLWLMPEGQRTNAPALAFAIIFTLFHFVLLPVIGAPALGLTWKDLVGPALRPAILAAVCSPIVFLAAAKTQHWTLVWMAVVAAAFGGAYGALSLAFFVRPHERRRITTAILARVGVVRARPESLRPAGQPPEPAPPELLEGTESSIKTGM